MYNVSGMQYLQVSQSNWYNKAKDFAVMWKNYAVKELGNIPQEMKKNPNVAIGVITTANLLFFLIMNSIGHHIQKKAFEKKPWEKELSDLSLIKLEEESTARRTVKHILISGLTGAATVGFNILFSRLTGYGMEPRLILSIAGVAWLAQLILNTVFQQRNSQIEKVNPSQEITTAALPFNESLPRKSYTS